ncbi:glycosyltransferase family 4 protein [Endozoicomonas sp. SESOKO3]|uniref:glycosyltransferase family 4 protein n=2 Tax=unclassified Endozoicomonas TaxID=2644528 RepID=UPI0021485AD7|nr:glycosyltransferase family 4 protein [Endozoicomonas sp. SESOKO3]
MKKLLKRFWRSSGLGLRWLAKKELPCTEWILLRLWPEHRFHLILFLFRNSHINKAHSLLTGFVPANHSEALWLERICSFYDMISGRHQWQLPEAESLLLPVFNQNVLMALHNSAPYDFAGYWYRSENILMQLRNWGVAIHCATRPGYPWDLQKHRGLPVTQADRVGGVVFQRLPAHAAPYKQGSDFRYVKEYSRQLAELATQQKATVIHGHSNYLNGLAAIEAARLAGVASVYEARGFWHLTRLSKEPDFANTDAFLYEENMEKLALREADRVVTLSQAMKSLIISWGINADKIHVIPNAVDARRFQPQPSDMELREQWPVSGFIVGFIGSITPYEGLLDLTAAVKRLRAQGIAISLVIAGAGPYESELRKAINGCDYIYYAGAIPHSDVQRWYASFDCCAYPRRNDAVCRYVPPMKVLEAMAMEKPVVVSDLPPLTEMVEHGVTGLICRPDNADSLAECLEKLLEKQLAMRLATAAREWAENNRTWEQNGKQYVQMYSTI